MLLVVCQLSSVVIGFEDCKQCFVRFDPFFVSQMCIVSKISRFVYCLSVVDIVNKSFAPSTQYKTDMYLWTR